MSYQWRRHLWTVFHARCTRVGDQLCRWFAWRYVEEEAQICTGWWSFSWVKGLCCLPRGEADPRILHHLHCKTTTTKDDINIDNSVGVYLTELLRSTAAQRLNKTDNMIFWFSAIFIAIGKMHKLPQNNPRSSIWKKKKKHLRMTGVCCSGVHFINQPVQAMFCWINRSRMIKAHNHVCKIKDATGLNHAMLNRRLF